MNCQAVEHWLLTSRHDDRLPRSLRRHLGACVRCRRCRRKLRRAERELQASAAPGADAGLQKFLGQLATLPAQEALPVSEEAASRRTVLYWAASILLFISMVAVYLHTREPEFVEPDRSSVPMARGKKEIQAEDRLVTRFVERDLVLAGTVTPAKQWQVFADMADDLRVEAIRLADEKKPDDLPMVASLYERVLQRGLCGRAGALPEADRKDLLPSFAERLRAHDRSLEDRLQQAAPNWVTLLQPLQKANRQSLHILVANGPAPLAADTPPAIPGAADYRRLLLSALVVNGIRLAEETDPLKRADCCSNLADHLLQAIVTASVKGDDHNVSVLGKNLGEFVDRGVSVNLARVPASDPRVAELKDVMQRTNQIMVALDKTLVQMSASAKIEPDSFDRLHDLEKMLKDVEKSLKKVHRAFKEAEKEREKKERDAEKEKEKKEKEKNKGKGKSKKDLSETTLPQRGPPHARIAANPRLERARRPESELPATGALLASEGRL